MSGLGVAVVAPAVGTNDMATKNDDGQSEARSVAVPPSVEVFQKANDQLLSLMSAHSDGFADALCQASALFLHYATVAGAESAKAVQERLTAKYNEALTEFQRLFSSVAKVLALDLAPKDDDAVKPGANSPSVKEKSPSSSPDGKRFSARVPQPYAARRTEFAATKTTTPNRGSPATKAPVTSKTPKKAPQGVVPASAIARSPVLAIVPFEPVPDGSVAARPLQEADESTLERVQQPTFIVPPKPFLALLDSLDLLADRILSCGPTSQSVEGGLAAVVPSLDLPKRTCSGEDAVHATANAAGETELLSLVCALSSSKDVILHQSAHIKSLLSRMNDEVQLRKQLETVLATSTALPPPTASPVQAAMTPDRPAANVDADSAPQPVALQAPVEEKGSAATPSPKGVTRSVERAALDRGRKEGPTDSSPTKVHIPKLQLSKGRPASSPAKAPSPTAKKAVAAPAERTPTPKRLLSRSPLRAAKSAQPQPPPTAEEDGSTLINRSLRQQGIEEASLKIGAMLRAEIVQVLHRSRMALLALYERQLHAGITATGERALRAFDNEAFLSLRADTSPDSILEKGSSVNDGGRSATVGAVLRLRSLLQAAVDEWKAERELQQREVLSAAKRLQITKDLLEKQRHATFAAEERSQKLAAVLQQFVLQYAAEEVGGTTTVRN